MAQTRYDEKIGRIRAGRYRKGDFILADAKDSDHAGGVLSMGLRRGADGRPAGPRGRAGFLEQIRAVIAQDVIDIMLASTANIEALEESGAFAGTRIKPAFRGNDSTDIWGRVRGGRYTGTPSIPFRSADLSLARADLCLYSVTFNNDARADLETLSAYAAFRADARAAGKKHFLEVFNPNVATGFDARETGMYVNDCIMRILAGLTARERPEFLKVAYNGPAALEELAGHDPAVVVGVLGGGTGTHRDTFELVRQAEKYGARLALFGRKIDGAEHQPALITWLRAVADGDADPAEAVRGYHAELAKMGIGPDRPLDDDLLVTETPLKEAA